MIVNLTVYLLSDGDDAAALLHVLTKTAGSSGTAPGTQVSVFGVDGAGNLAFDFKRC